MASMRPKQNTLARSLHDLGLAAWFGGSLMGASSVNPSTRELSDPTDRARMANATWGRWSVYNAAAITAHLLGGAQLVRANKGRVAVQRGARSVNLVKAGLTAAALGVTAYTGLQGKKIMGAETRAAEVGRGMPVADATTPQPGTGEAAAEAQRQLTPLQWAVPALTGALFVLNAKAGEQQRPAAAIRGALGTRPGQWGAGGLLGTVLGLFGLVKVLGALTNRSRRTRARDIMTAGPEPIAELDSLSQAARRMRELDVGAMPIVGTDGRLRGMLTDRDIIVKVLAEGRDPSTVTAGELAQGQPVTIDADDSVHEALRLMSRHGIRRLPVTDHDRLVGVVTQADVAINLDDAHVGELVEVISRSD